jgi:membrane protein YqaA with SNARE-associated domain
MTLLSLWITTVAVCIVGSIIPLVNTEVYLLAVSAVAPREFVVPLVVAATIGQMLGKVVMYYAGRGMVRVRSVRVRERVADWRAKLEKRPWLARGVLFSSATLGLPPLYVVTLTCGAIGMSLATFVVIGSIGRLIHFAVVALLPQYAKLLIG